MRHRVFVIVTTCFVLSNLLFLSPKDILAQKNTGKPPAKIETPTEIEWLSYDAGIAKAKKEGKHILIDFYTNWCGWCKKMDRTTFKDKAVVSFVSEKMVAVKVNAESRNTVQHEGRTLTERELSRMVYAATGYPTYWFLNPKGEKLFRAPGYRGASEFLSLVEYVGDSHYNKASFKAFLESKKSGKKSSH